MVKVNINSIKNKVDALSEENLIQLSSDVYKLYESDFYITSEEALNSLASSVFYISKCPYCGEKIFLISDKDFYEEDHGSKMYICSNYERCGNYVGVYKDTVIPLWFLCGRSTKQYRKQVHTIIDILISEYKMSYLDIYKLLGDELNLPRERASKGMFNIAMLNIDQYKKAYNILNKYRIVKEDFYSIKEFDIGNIPLEFYLPR